jgi:sugar phosphate permease
MALIVGMHFSMLFMLVQFFQRVLGFAPLMAGLAYVPLTATVFAVPHFVPQLMKRFGPRLLLGAGSVLVAISLALFAMLDDNSGYLGDVLLPIMIDALGVALVFAPGTVAIMHGVPDEHAGSASGLLQMDQQLGGALGIAIIASVYSMEAQPGRFVPGLSAAFIVAASIAMVAAVIALRTSKRA